MKTYSMDVQLWATIYVEAASEEEAEARLLGIVKGECLEIAGRDLHFADDAFLSPAVTLTGEHCELNDAD